MLIILSILFIAIALLSVIWILVPAPAPFIWLYSVAVSEWSIWFGALALTGMACALLNYVFYRNGGLLLIALIVFGGVSLAISLYPFLTSISPAREKNISLSWRQYFSALTISKASTNQIKTYIYNNEFDLKLDVYSASNEVIHKHVGIIVVHGGSWSGGKRRDFPQWDQWLAENGFVVFDIDYRLAPQPNYLTAIGDVKCAVNWVKEHSADFAVDADKIILLGRSAGAHLALIAAYSAGDVRLPASCPETAGNENVRAVISFYAPTDFLWDYDNPANQFVIDGPKTLSNFLGGNPHQSSEILERYILASPSAHVTAGTPPTLLIHGGKDQLVKSENLDILANKLNQVNAVSKTLYLPYAQHGFDYNFNGWGSQITKSVILEFLDENTKDKSVS